jgi:hypothetical protein
MRFDLKTPCKNCPFRTDEAAIRFRCASRAEEIAESAYRNGFPCHLSAEIDEDDEEPGYEFGENTQHCAGAIIMFLKSDYGSGWPGIGNDEDLAERLSTQMNMDAPVFDTEEEFIEASRSDFDEEEEAA